MYKIIAKAMAFRICQHVPKLVHMSQAGFVQGHSLMESVISVWVGLEAYLKEKEHILLKVDFEKAYDKSERGIIIDFLGEMNFGNKFSLWIKTLMEGVNALIQINGTCSKKINITRSVRQGCPLDPLLFVFAKPSL